MAGTSIGVVAWWRPLVAGLLLAGTSLTLYVAVTAVLGTVRDPVSPRWQNALALALCLGAARPVWRWLHPRVHELADSSHRPQAVMAAVSGPLVTVEGGVARAVAKALNLPWVELELDGRSSAGRRPDGADVIEVPVQFRGDLLGVIRVAGSRRVSRLTAADLDVLRELAHQLALRVAAERAAERLTRSRTEIVAAREDERLRMRRDLHDGLAPSLASIRLQLTAFQHGLRGDEQRRRALDGILEDLRHTSADLRGVVYDLRPPMLDDLGLRGTLLQQFGALTVPAVHLDFEDPEVPAAVEVAVLRIAAESVMNAARHSRAADVVVRVEVEGALVRLSVEDDGAGFDARIPPGVGLSSMHERAEELGGSVVVDSTPGGGTRVTAVIGWSS